MQILKGHKDQVRCLAYSPDGRTLASGGDDHQVILWDLVSGKAKKTWPAHGDWVRAMVFSPDGKGLATGGLDDCVKWWWASGRRQHQARLGEEHPGGVWALAHAPDGSFLAAGCGNGLIRTYSQLKNDGRHFALRHHSCIVRALAFAPDNRTLASAGHDGEIILWDSCWGQPQAFLEGHGDWILSLAFSPNGKLLVSGGHDGRLLLWDVERRRLLVDQLAHENRICHVAFAPDGRTVFSAGWDGVVQLWNAEGIPGRTLDWGIGRVHCLVIAPDGLTAAAGGSDHSILVWDLE